MIFTLDQAGGYSQSDLCAKINECVRALNRIEQPDNGKLPLQPEQHQYTNDIIAFCIYAAVELKEKGYVTIDKNTGWGNILESIAQQRHL